MAPLSSGLMLAAWSCRTSRPTSARRSLLLQCRGWSSRRRRRLSPRVCRGSAAGRGRRRCGRGAYPQRRRKLTRRRKTKRSCRGRWVRTSACGRVLQRQQVTSCPPRRHRPSHRPHRPSCRRRRRRRPPRCRKHPRWRRRRRLGRRRRRRRAWCGPRQRLHRSLRRSRGPRSLHAALPSLLHRHPPRPLPRVARAGGERPRRGAGTSTSGCGRQDGKQDGCHPPCLTGRRRPR
mmetsp:Transcript_99034/g.317665  ORF Transcript_99034/g.317665 Transcript_99034/m.317665 type:complete len:233 (+) Transcript_99034:167-865(+)